MKKYNLVYVLCMFFVLVGCATSSRYSNKVKLIQGGGQFNSYQLSVVTDVTLIISTIDGEKNEFQLKNCKDACVVNLENTGDGYFYITVLKGDEIIVSEQVLMFDSLDSIKNNFFGEYKWTSLTSKLGRSTLALYFTSEGNSEELSIFYYDVDEESVTKSKAGYILLKMNENQIQR